MKDIKRATSRTAAKRLSKQATVMATAAETLRIMEGSPVIIEYLEMVGARLSQASRFYYDNGGV